MKRVLIISKEAMENNRGLVNGFEGSVTVFDNTIEGYDADMANALRKIGVNKLPAIILMPEGAENCRQWIKDFNFPTGDSR